jgi:peptidoglycan/LPS O-acetylase OafA/YrhL
MNKRIEILDSFRVIAILMVMFYHYYYRFNGKHYDFPDSISNQLY